jgi:hypothetical protein
MPEKSKFMLRSLLTMRLWQGTEENRNDSEGNPEQKYDAAFVYSNGQIYLRL